MDGLATLFERSSFLRLSRKLMMGRTTASEPSGQCFGAGHTALACRLILSTGVLSSTFQQYRLRVIARVPGTWSSNCDRGTVGDDHPVARDRTKRVFFIYRRHRPALDAPGARAARGLAIVVRVSPDSRLVQKGRAGAGGAAGEGEVAGVEWEIRQGRLPRGAGCRWVMARLAS